VKFGSQKHRSVRRIFRDRWQTVTESRFRVICTRSRCEFQENTTHQRPQNTSPTTYESTNFSPLAPAAPPPPLPPPLPSVTTKSIPPFPAPSSLLTYDTECATSYQCRRQIGIQMIGPRAKNLHQAFQCRHRTRRSLLFRRLAVARRLRHLSSLMMVSTLHPHPRHSVFCHCYEIAHLRGAHGTVLGSGSKPPLAVVITHTQQFNSQWSMQRDRIMPTYR